MIDAVLAILLFMKNDWGHVIVLIRAFFGFIIWTVIKLFTYKGAADLEAIIMQAVFCIGLMLLLGGRTTTWRLFVGATTALLLVIHWGIIAYFLTIGNTVGQTIALA